MLAFPPLRSSALLLAGWMIFTAIPATADGPSGATPLKVAILVFDGVQVIDFAGPFDVFSGGGFEVFTVSPTSSPVRTTGGLEVTATYSFASHPQPDILILPGGTPPGPSTYDYPWNHAMPIVDDPAIFRWVGDNVAAARHVLTVCNGAFILARLGLLDGLEATTTAHLLALLEQASPTTRVRRDQRVTDNGKILLSGGLSAGIDGSLRLIEKLYGRGEAARKALGLEYRWQPDDAWARGVLAERHSFFRIEPRHDPRWRLVRHEGTSGRWVKEYEVSGIAVDEVRERVESRIAEPHFGSPTWHRIESGDSTSADVSSWQFADEHGMLWLATSRVIAASADQVSVRIEYYRTDHEAPPSLRDEGPSPHEMRHPRAGASAQ